jgi:hypothetical protein
MLSNQNSYIQAYNCQAVVESFFYLIIEAHLTNLANDKQEIKPAVNELKKLKDSLSNIRNLDGTGEISAPSTWWEASGTERKVKSLRPCVYGRRSRIDP